MATPLYPITPTATRHNGQAYAQVSDGAIATSENLVQTGYTDPVSSLPWMTIQGAFEWCAYLDANLVGAVVPLAGGVTLAGNNTYSGTSTFTGPVVINGAVTFGAAGVLEPRCSTITPTTETITAQTKDLWELAEPASDVVLTLATPGSGTCSVAFLMTAAFVTYSVTIKDVATNVLATFAPTVGPTSYVAWVVLTYDGTAWKAAEFSTDAPTYATLAANSGTDGSQLVGVKALASTVVPPGGGLVSLTLGPGNLRSALATVMANLVPASYLAQQVPSSSNPAGTSWIGWAAYTSPFESTSATTLTLLLEYILGTRPVMSAGQIAIPSAQQAAANVVEHGAISAFTPAGWAPYAEGSWLDSGASISATAGDEISQEITAPHGSLITQVRAWVTGGGAVAGVKPATNPGTTSPLALAVLEQNILTGAVTYHPSSGWYADTATNGTTPSSGEYGVRHAITSPTLAITVNRATSRYYVLLAGEYGAGSAQTAIFWGSDRLTTPTTIGQPT